MEGGLILDYYQSPGLLSKNKPVTARPEELQGKGTKCRGKGNTIAKESKLSNFERAWGQVPPPAVTVLCLWTNFYHIITLNTQNFQFSCHQKFVHLALGDPMGESQGSHTHFWLRIFGNE